MSDVSDRDFIDKTREQLRASESELDELTVARLRAIRLRAVESAAPRRRRQAVFGGALAASLAMVIAVGVFWTQRPGEPPPLEDMPMLSAGDDLQMLQDIDFYLWLEYGADVG